MSLRVAMLAPIAWRVPPRSYGPWERVVSLLTEGLVERAVDVTLFATADSLTNGTLAAICPRPYEEDASLDPKVWECLHIASAFERAGEFDIIHNHFDFLPLSYSRLTATPVLTTIHGFSSERILPVYQRYDDCVHYVAISEADRHPTLSYAATIHHGIDVGAFSFARRPGRNLVFLGRIHPDKGVVEAIDTAARAKVPLVIAGIVQDRRYFDEEVRPRLDGVRVRFVGEVGTEARDELLSSALALLHLVNFDEPFGLSMVEAMACGTPVIATRRGSVPEVVLGGVSGFVVGDVAEAAAAVEACAQLDRRAIRSHVQRYFSQARMVSDYLEVYEQILGGGR